MDAQQTECMDGWMDEYAVEKTERTHRLVARRASCMYIVHARHGETPRACIIRASLEMSLNISLLLSCSV
jgi:hypothetical protein